MCRFLVLLITLLSSSVALSQKPPCDIDVVTNNCEFFKKRSDQSVIKASNGTFYQNPLFIPELAKLETRSCEASSCHYLGGIDVNKLIDEQAEVVDAFSDSKFSTRFKMAFSLVAQMGKPVPGRTYKMPDPIDDPQGPYKEIDGAELMKKVNSNLSEKNRTALEQVFQRKKAESEKREALLQEAERKKRLAEQEQMKKVKADMAKMDKRVSEIKALFENLKLEVIDMISEGRPEAKLSEAEKNLIGRVRLLEYKVPTFEDAEILRSCMGENVNAYYYAVRHTVSICPSGVFLPDTSVTFILAHEIGHAIDPCRSSQGLYKVDKVRLKEFLAQNRGKMNSGDFDTLGELTLQESPYYSVDPDFVLSDRKVAEELFKKDIIKDLYKPVRMEDHAFNTEYQCLQKDLNLVSADKETVDTTLKGKRRIAQSLYMKNPKEQDVLMKNQVRFEEAIQKHPECFETIRGKSQVGEGMGDMIGAAALNRRIRIHPLVTEEDKVGALWLAHKQCTNQGAMSAVKSYELAPQVYSEVLKIWTLEHPLSDQRMVKLALNQPEMQKTYNCKRVYKNCFDHLGVPSSALLGNAAHLKKANQ